MPTYLLDILVEEAQLYACCSQIRTPIWITIRADGLQQPFDTPAVPASPRPSWRTPVRFVLNLPNLTSGHFRATLRTTGYLNEVISIACSQVRLNSLPSGRPGRFNFPLQNTQDFSVQAATLCVTASISEVSFQAPTQPRPVLPPVWALPTPDAWTQNTAPPPQPPPAPWAGYPGAVPRHGTSRR
jgi:hypothetical protein